MENEIKKLLEKNLELNQDIFKMVKSIKSYILWARIFGVLKILIIVIPIILGLIYLPPLLKNVFNNYQGLLGLDKSALEGLLGGGLAPDKIKLDNIPSDFKKYIK